MIINDSKYSEHWAVKPLNKLGDFSRWKSKHRPRNDEKLFVNGKYPFIQTWEVKSANMFIKKHNWTYNEFWLNQSKIWKEWTLCITIAANIAETAILEYPMCFPDSIVWFNAFPDESSEIFMYYLFGYIKKAIQNSASWSIQDNINIDYLTSLRLRIPHKDYQNKIVKVLESIDFKIENNIKINLQLEEMAKTLYGYWFFQFDFPDKNWNPYKSSGWKMVWNEELKREIPEGWEYKNLSSIFEFQKWVEPWASEYFDTRKDMNSIWFYRVWDIDWVTTTYIDRTLKDFQIANEDDVLVTFDGSVWKLWFWIHWAFSSWLRKIYDKTWKFNNALVFSIFRDERIIATIHQFATWSIILHASSSIEHLAIPFEEDTYLNFQEKVSPIYQKLVDSKKENKKLWEIRDWLLPMLMNGQVSVK